MKTLLMLLFFTCSTVAFADSFLVEEIGGSQKIKIKRNTKIIEITKGASLEYGDEISTDAVTVVDIRYPDKSLVRIGNNTQFLIEKDTSATLLNKWSSKLLHGFLRVLVPETKNPKNIRFQLRTPTGTMGVRGTEFVVEYSEKSKLTSLKTYKGEVLFGPPNIGFDNLSQFVLVSAGKKGSTSIDGIPQKLESFDIKTDKNNYLKNEKGNPFASLAWRKSGALEEKETQVGKTNQTVAPSNTAIAKKVKVLRASTTNSPQDKLLSAVMDRKLIAAQDAIKAGANAKFKYAPTEDTALHVAALSRFKELIQYLIDAGADVNATNNQGETPLMLIAKDSDIDLDIALILLQNDANLSLKDHDGHTATDIAKLNKDGAELAKFLENWAQQHNH